MIKNPKLPKLPSAFLRHALGRLRQAEADERYYIDLGKWHSPSKITHRCCICLAGAVIAYDFKVSPEATFTPNRLAMSGTKLDAINQLHLLCDLSFGLLADAFHRLGVPNAETYPKCASIGCEYDENRENWYRFMFETALHLEMKGF